jgi:zinc protease
VTSKSIIFVFLILSLTGLVFGQTGKIDNIAAQAAQVTEFEVNGLKVLVKRRPSAPTVAAALFLRGGARNINDKNAGIEGLMLKSAIEAGKKYPRQTVRRELSRAGSGIGSAVSNDYSLVSLGTTRTNFDRIWNIFTDVTLNPAFAPADITRNKQSILTGLRESEISPEAALQVAIDRRVYERHPYANDVNGTSATIERLTAKDLVDYHKDMMKTSRLLLVFVGDLDPSEIKAKVEASFGKLPRGDYRDAPYPALDFTKTTVDVVARPNLPTNYVQGVLRRRH